MNEIEERARAFAGWAHASCGQLRKYTGEPYIVHPEEVAEIIREVCPDDASLIAAAYLHDTVEDTGVTLHRVRSLFGDDVADLVEMVTDVSRPEDGDRAARKAIDRAHTATATPRGKTLKLADLIANTSSIVRHDPEFAVVYIAEKMLLLGVLADGNPELYERALRICREAEEELARVFGSACHGRPSPP